MGKIYLLKQIGEYCPKSARDDDRDLYLYEIGTKEEENKITQEEQGPYIADNRIDELKIKVKKLEAVIAKIKSDPSIGKLEVEDWPESPDY
jgi:hypothetical protein